MYLQTIEISTGAETIEFSCPIPSNISGNVSPGILHDCLLMRFSLLRKNVEKGLTATPNRYKYNYGKRVRETTVFKVNWLIFVDRTTAAGTGVSKTTDTRHKT